MGSLRFGVIHLRDVKLSASTEILILLSLNLSYWTGRMVIRLQPATMMLTTFWELRGSSRLKRTGHRILRLT